MAAIATSCTFPDQQATINYINAHPCKQQILDEPTIASITPNAAAIISEFFAGKTLPRNTIESNVRKLLADDIALAETSEDFKHVKRLAQKTILAEEHADAISTIDKTMEMSARKAADSAKSANKVFEFPVAVYTQILNELLDKTTYTKGDGKTWTKHVADLTKEKS